MDFADQTNREAPAKITALSENFTAGMPVKELLAASSALEKQIKNLHDGKDWADETVPLLQQLLEKIAAEKTPLNFKVSIARCTLLQLSHLWYYCDALHSPFIAWTIQHLLNKNALPEIQAACELITELVTRASERDQETDAEERSVNSEVTRVAFDRLEELADLDQSPLRASTSVDAQALAEALLNLLQLNGEPEPLDRVMGRVVTFFTTTHDLSMTSKLPVNVREDLLDIGCDFLNYDLPIINGKPFVDPVNSKGSLIPTEKEMMEMARKLRVHTAVNQALVPSVDGGPSLFACVLRIVRECPAVPKNMLQPCKYKVVDFALRFTIGLLVSAASDDAQFELAQRAGELSGEAGVDALFIVLRAFKMHRFHLFDGDDDQIFHHIDRSLRSGAQRTAWAIAEERTGPIYDDSGMYVDY
jgi:hypothetical protein